MGWMRVLFCGQFLVPELLMVLGWLLYKRRHLPIGERMASITRRLLFGQVPLILGAVTVGRLCAEVASRVVNPNPDVATLAGISGSLAAAAMMGLVPGPLDWLAGLFARRLGGQSGELIRSDMAVGVRALVIGWLPLVAIGSAVLWLGG